MRLRHASAIAVAVAAVFLGATAADAKCQKLSFLVNDYGKDGPTRDAKNLLDKYIVDWTKEKGIANYTVGKKDVSCELYLDLLWWTNTPARPRRASAGPARPKRPLQQRPRRPADSLENGHGVRQTLKIWA
jgi:hypothetical protein